MAKNVITNFHDAYERWEGIPDKGERERKNGKQCKDIAKKIWIIRKK